MLLIINQNIQTFVVITTMLVVKIKIVQIKSSSIIILKINNFNKKIINICRKFRKLIKNILILKNKIQKFKQNLMESIKGILNIMKLRKFLQIIVILKY